MREQNKGKWTWVGVWTKSTENGGWDMRLEDEKREENVEIKAKAKVLECNEVGN